VLELVWQLVRAPLVAEMAKNKAAMQLAGVKSVSDANADEALAQYAAAALDEKLSAATLGATFADGAHYEALLKARASRVFAKRKQQLHAARAASSPRYHAALARAFASLKAAALTSPHAMAAGNKRQHFCQLAALFCAEPLQ
jgi:hypothetical protein